VAIGPQTAAAALAADLKISLVATDHSLRGMIVALSTYFSSST
jgi:uroporphyrinogen-III synthase